MIIKAFWMYNKLGHSTKIILLVYPYIFIEIGQPVVIGWLNICIKILFTPKKQKTGKQCWLKRVKIQKYEILASRSPQQLFA